MSIVPRLTYGDLDLTDHPFLWEFGGDLGAPQNVSELVESLLQDGEIVSTRRRSNREITLTVLIDDADMIALAEAEASLAVEADKPRNLLTVDPGDGLGPATVFETFAAQVQFVRDDDFEQSGVRRYVLSIPALPFGRSVDPVSVSTTATVSPTRTVLLDGSTTAGWTAQYQVALAATTLSGRTCIQATGTGGWSASGSSFTKQTATRVTVTSPSTFLTVDYLAARAGDGLSAVVAGASAPLSIAASEVQSDGFVRYYFDTSGLVGSSVIQFTVQHYQSGAGAPAEPVYYLDGVATQDGIAAANAKESLRSLPIVGSARAPGSISVSHGSTALGDVLVFTSPDLDTGFVPHLRSRRTAGDTVTTDAAMISGARESLSATAGTTFTATVPYRMYAPGPYLIVARVRVSTETVALEAQCLAGSEVTGDCRTLAETTGGAFVVRGIGVLTLPAREASATATGTFTIKVAFDARGGAGTAELDEAWAFPMNNSALTIASGLTYSRLWLDSPSLDAPRGLVLMGDQANRSDAYSAYSKLVSKQDHLLTPGQLLAYVAASGPSTPVTLGVDYLPHWHTNAGQ